MFLPKSKYKGPFTAAGGDKELLVKSTLKPFRGKYIVTYKNQYFEGETPQEAKRELILRTVFEEQEANKNKLEKPKAKVITPTEKDYKNKKFKRYFIKDTRSGRIIETDKSEYNKAKTLPAHSSLILEWYIKAPAKDTKYRGYIYYGAETRNRNALSEAEKQMRGLSSYLTDLAQFVQ